MPENDIKSNGSFLSLARMRQNPWILTTIFLAVVLVVYFFLNGGSLTGNVVSEDVAAKNLVSFIEAQGGTAEVVSTEQINSMYKVTVSYQGQDIPVYITLDGKYIASSLLPLTSTNASAKAPASSASTSAKTVPKTDKPVVDAFIFSYCPYGLQFEKALLPAYDLLKSKADINIVAIGAMHGEYEHQESLRQISIEQLYSTDKLFAYLKEFDYNTDIGSCRGEASCLDKYLPAIYTKLGIDKAKVEDYMSESAEAIYAEQGDLASSLGISGSPTFVINGVETQVARTPQAIQQAICDAFTTAPTECAKNLSSGALSAGFGGTSGASTGASCGA